MLTYQETIWKESAGYETKKIQLKIESIQSFETIKEQSARIEKISLVVFLKKEQKKILNNVSKELNRNDSDFYQNHNLHVTVLGFGPLVKTSYEAILTKIQEYSRKKQSTKLAITFDTIRPGTMYSGDTKLNPVSGKGNGTVVALGDVNNNKEFCNYSNELTTFILKEKKIKSVLGANFRKRLPSVWCSLGYYHKPGTFRIGEELETIFRHYNDLRSERFRFDVSKICLVKSDHKNLADLTILDKFNV